MRKLPERNPINGTFELTGRCNLSCNMCYVRTDSKYIKESGKRERTADEWIDLARQAAEAGTLSLLLTGGEVLLRPDFPHIYEEIAQMGFLLTVYTNATLVDERIMEIFRKYPPHKIGITMYGASNDTYYRVCNSKNGFDLFVAGLKKLMELPSVIDIRTTIIKDNISDLSSMREFVRDTFDKDKILHISRNVSDTIRGGVACPKLVRLEPEDNIEIVYPWLAELYKKVLSGEVKIDKIKVLNTAPKRHKLANEGQYLFTNCGAGLVEYAISWDGKMYACGMLNQGHTDPFLNGFAYAWEHLPEKYPLSKSITECNDCKFVEFCDSCPANRLAETGDYFGVPEYACREAKQVYKILKEIQVINYDNNF